MTALLEGRHSLKNGARLGGEQTAAPRMPDVLTRDEVAAWLKVKPRQVERLGIPSLNLGPKTKRYLAKDVLAWLDEQRVDRAA